METTTTAPVPAIPASVVVLPLRAFNLWEGAVVLSTDNVPHVVFKLERDSDTERVTIAVRPLSCRPGANLTSVMSFQLLGYNDEARVVGSVANPADLDDDDDGAVA